MKNTVRRRDFLNKSLGLCSAGALLSSGTEMRAEGTLRRPERYEENVSILERKPFTWPGGKTLAIWIAPNVEVFVFTPAGTKGAQGDQDVLGYSWREYGMRVGLWRIADVMEQAGARATVALNAAVCDVWPKAIEKMDALGWEMMGHNVTNSRNIRGLPLEKEIPLVQSTVKIIQQATGKKVRGWLGSGLTETFSTLDLLSELGIEYTGDWNNDDLPYPMKTKSGTIYAINYGNAINDTSFYGKGHTGEEYYQMAVNQFETLYAESQKIPRVMGMPLHPYHTGQPLRIKYFQKAIQYMKKREKVWFATGGEILDAYLKAQA
jgi:peptidoglycan/xylan/chitin deacetylase (PgdA/CDA1 family)